MLGKALCVWKRSTFPTAPTSRNFQTRFSSPAKPTRAGQSTNSPSAIPSRNNLPSPIAFDFSVAVPMADGTTFSVHHQFLAETGQQINARPVFFRHNIHCSAEVLTDSHFRGVSSGVLVTRNRVPLPNESLKNLHHQARACDMSSPLIVSINSFFNVSNAKNIDHNQRLPRGSVTENCPLISF